MYIVQQIKENITSLTYIQEELSKNIKDVVVLPEYQGKGIGRLLIDELLKFINENGVPNTHIWVELCAMPDKIPFYEKFGFSANEAQRLRIIYPVEK